MKKASAAVRLYLTALIIILCASAPCRAAEPAKVREALRASERALGLQTRLPVSSDKKITPEEFWPDRFMPRRGSVSGLSSFIFYISLAVIVSVLFMTWRGNMWSASRERRFERGTAKDMPASAEVSARMEKAQLEADDLAGRGSFAEAIHVLLLRSLDELRGGLGVSIAVSLTSREILRHVGLPPEGRLAFADIIGRAEVSYFGTHRPDEADYAACRSSFDSLTGVLRQYAASH